MTDETRTPTQIDKIADAWVDTLAELEPTLATYIGRAEYNDRFGDYSPAGQERLVDEGRKTLAALHAADATDDIDAVTKDDLSQQIQLELDLHDAKWHLRDLNVIAGRTRAHQSIAASPTRASVRTGSDETAAAGAAGLRSLPGRPRSGSDHRARAADGRPGWPALRCPAASSRPTTA